MSVSAGLAAWSVAFQQSPIILSNGLASFMPGSMIPIMAITEAINFPLGLLSGGNAIDLDNFFANFAPIPGGTLLDQRVGRYPFANQTVAANAVIAEPLKISMRMTCPARGDLGFFAKLAIITALQAALAQHNAKGGTYIIATPSFIYTNCVMTGMRDASTGQTQQPQNTFQFDFEKPLLTLEQAEAAQNSLFSAITAGINPGGLPAFSGLATSVGQAITVAAPSIVPAATAAVGAQSIITSPLPPLSAASIAAAQL
jgi:hypothetical protein